MTDDEPPADVDALVRRAEAAIRRGDAILDEMDDVPPRSEDVRRVERLLKASP